MSGTSTGEAGGGHAAVSAVLFLCLFAAQGALIAMSPVLAEAARDLDVSTAAAGQLRTVAALSAGITALSLGSVAGRIGVGRQLLAASALLALGSLASAAAPGFALLAAAQVPVGIAVAILTTAGTLAAAEWVPPRHRTRALSWALVGQPAAWIVGMPLVGLVGERSWRYGWLALPLAAAVLVAVSVARRAGAPPARRSAAGARAVLRERDLARWLASELLANAAWTGTLVYAGALLVESYGSSAGRTGGLLALAAVAYVGGNLASRRLVRRDPRPLLVALALALALGVLAFGAVRPHVAVSTALLSVAALGAGARTLVSGSLALSAPVELRPAATALRAATIQLGTFVGSITGGAALALGGYGAYGAAMAGLFLAAAATLAGVGGREPVRAPRFRLLTGGGRRPEHEPAEALR